MKIKILKTFQQDFQYYMKGWELELYDFGPFYQWSNDGHTKMIVYKKFIDDRISKGIIQVI